MSPSPVHSRLPGARRSLLALAAVAALVLACDRPRGVGDESAQDSARADHWEALSSEGLYRVSIAPRSGQARVGPLDAWIVSVETADGAPVFPSRLAFDGGMPQHGHGFETSPRVVGTDEDGRFVVDGVRFHMPGEWTLRVEVVAPPGPDVAVFRVAVRP